MFSYVCSFKVTFFFSTENEYGEVAETILSTLQAAGINVRAKRGFHHFLYPYFTNPFYDLLEETHQDTRSKYHS